MVMRTPLRMEFEVRNWNVQTKHSNNIFMATQEKQGVSSNFGNQANLLSPAILVDDIQVNSQHRSK
jgi:hypothetical protein